MVEMDKPQLTTLITQSKQKLTNFTTWHRCLAHARTETIHQMITENLVDELNIYGKSSMGGLCKDCIYGKHVVYPYNDNKSREKEILECIYIDIWGPYQIQSAKGALYFMIIMDGFSSYQMVTFLKSKSPEVTLNIFKSFHTEAERQTSRKLRQVQLDIGREWYNSAWKCYHDKQRLDFEFMTPYAYQQNCYKTAGELDDPQWWIILFLFLF